MVEAQGHVGGQRVTCRLCGSAANLVYAGHHGFRAPARYDVYECSQCETSFAEPMQVDHELYELIYRNSDQLAGYRRYERYRALLAASADPLGDLCRREDVYWAVREALRSLENGRAAPLKVCELGSGLGYLTYALRRAGYDCTGADVSRAAVASAARSFGDYYRVADFDNPSAGCGDPVDVMIATELIEHLADPRAFLVSAAARLAPGGAIVLTTPDRGIYPLQHAWSTDPPPVHLWWFSQTSFRYLAWELGMSARFVDFTGFYTRPRAPPPRRLTKPQSFDANGNVIFKDTALKTAARRALAAAPWLFRPLGGLFLTSLSLARSRETLLRQSLSLCVILQPKPKLERAPARDHGARLGRSVVAKA